MQIGEGPAKTSVWSFLGVVANCGEKPIPMEPGFCIGPLFLSCLTFSSTVETYADFSWKFGTKLDTTTSFFKNPSKPNDLPRLDSEISLIQKVGTLIFPTCLNGSYFFPGQCRQGFKECDIVELRVK